MSNFYYEKTWQEIKEYADKDALIVLPVGTTEEHGPHLPVETDAMVAEGYGALVGEEIAKHIPVLVMRSVHYGYSMGCVCDFPGTITIRSRVLMDYVFDILDSLVKMGFTKIVVLNCHGNHDGGLRVVMRELVDKYGVYIGVISPSRMSDYNKIKKDPQGDIHAGESETSLMLALNEKLVRTEKYTNVDALNLDRSLLGPVSTWGLQDTVTGSFGDPTYATKEMGEVLLQTGARNTADWCIRYYNFFKEKQAQKQKPKSPRP